MSENPKTPERKPLAKSELEPFLLWLYNNTGHVGNVELWRKSKEIPAAGAAAGSEQE